MLPSGPVARTSGNDGVRKVGAHSGVLGDPSAKSGISCEGGLRLTGEEVRFLLAHACVFVRSVLFQVRAFLVCVCGGARPRILVWKESAEFPCEGDIWC